MYKNIKTKNIQVSQNNIYTKYNPSNLMGIKRKMRHMQNILKDH